MADPQFATSPFEGVVAITPSDTTTYTSLRGVYVGGTGTVAVTMPDGSTATFSAVPVGTILPGKFSKINAASTATLIVGLK